MVQIGVPCMDRLALQRGPSEFEFHVVESGMTKREIQYH